jgi:hypothetical protein
MPPPTPIPAVPARRTHLMKACVSPWVFRTCISHTKWLGGDETGTDLHSSLRYSPAHLAERPLDGASVLLVVARAIVAGHKPRRGAVAWRDLEVEAVRDSRRRSQRRDQCKGPHFLCLRQVVCKGAAGGCQIIAVSELGGPSPIVQAVVARYFYHTPSVRPVATAAHPASSKGSKKREQSTCWHARLEAVDLA